MTMSDAVRLSTLLAHEPTTLWELARPVPVVAESADCCELLRELRAAGGRDPAAVVVGSDPRRIGVVSGRAFLLAHLGSDVSCSGGDHCGTLGASTDFSVEVLPHDAALGFGVNALLARSPREREDDFLLHRNDSEGIQRWRALSIATLMTAAAGRMAWRASRDPLTGLLNRSAFFAELDTLLAHVAGRPGGRVGVVSVHLDRLKTVNDTLGHDAGDALIQSVSRRLQDSSGPHGLVGRLGGGEFAVALPLPGNSSSGDESETSGARLQALAAALLADARTADADLDPQGRSTVSIGAALSVPVLRTGGSGPLLRRAGSAMRAAKVGGGDRVGPVAVREVVEEEVSPPHLSLHQALARSELVLHYQPIVGSASGRTVSFEALVRWSHPDLGLLGADRVLDRAQDERLEVVLDRWVLRTALRQLHTWTGQSGRDFPTVMNVNVSLATLSSPDLADIVLDAVREARCRPDQLRLELPETAPLETCRAAVPQLRRLGEEGVALVIDDMGAGASSLRYLSTIPVVGIKIDRSFVRNMFTSRSDHAVVAMLTNLALGLNIHVTAEGVETVEQVHELTALGVSDLQGYYFSRPQPAEVFR